MTRTVLGIAGGLVLALSALAGCQVNHYHGTGGPVGVRPADPPPTLFDEVTIERHYRENTMTVEEPQLMVR